MLILPLESVNSADSDYLGEGISEQITAKLSAVPSLRLTSAAAAQRILATGASPQEAGRRLNVEAVLFGSIRRIDRRVRVNAQLIRSEDGQVLWAEGGLHLEARDLLEAESLVATAIAAHLGQALTASERGAMMRRPTSSAEAFELLVRGKLALRSRTDVRLSLAEKLFQEAIQLDPKFAEAFAWLAMANYEQFSQGLRGDEAKRKALENAHKALRLDPSVAAARLALIRIFHSTGQAEEGLREAAIVSRSGMADVESLWAVAEAYLRTGMPDRSIPLLQRAMAIDPENENLRSRLSAAACWAGQYNLGLQVVNTSTSSFNAMLNASGLGNAEIVRANAMRVMRDYRDPFPFAIAWLVLREYSDMGEARRIWRA